MECCHADLNGLGIRGKKTNQVFGDQPGQEGSDAHDAHGEGKCRAENLLDALFFTGAVIVAHQGTDALDDSVCCQIDKGLQLIVDSKHEYVCP